ncbi:bifunctional protein GAL10 [Tothia fuscella]|uniref:Bifunctional protein GAL10 n=1 Tax=Tothia fuscella TaxID=1048955 RepID=A0A9P4NQI9_9PEZI|nr:bifunctional protein GAL10 [Tothia fuscella]
MSDHTEPSFKYLPLGAIIQEFPVGDFNLLQSFPTAELYQKFNAPYFGETVGRVANRISGAKINNLNGKSYTLFANNGPNSLHGGNIGWGKRVFRGPEYVQRGGKDAVRFSHLSPDGDEGYPGTVELKIWYTSSIEKLNGGSVSILNIEYEAELVGDDGIEETAIGVTNHSYFNLAGASTIEGTEVTLSTDLHQVVDNTSIPTGVIASFPGIEANKKFILGAQEPDIDHCFILNDQPRTVPVDTRELPMRLLAAFHHPTTKVHLEVHSTEPAFQFYTGRYIDVEAVGDVPARGPRSGFAVEPSRYINSINYDEWRNMVVLQRGEKFGSRIEYRAWRD